MVIRRLPFFFGGVEVTLGNFSRGKLQTLSFGGGWIKNLQETLPISSSDSSASTGASSGSGGTGAMSAT